MIYIRTNPNLSKTIARNILRKAALMTLDYQAFPDSANITLVLTDDSQLQALNRDFLGTDAPTDVLSFPSEESDPETGAAYLGDVLISVPRALLQAKLAGHSLDAEVQLLVVHGVLHLLGYDHANRKEKKRMWKAQGDILEKLGLGHIQVREE